jgi:ElaB/YqjD/DUF883 family membrane-anchored ribosome-binding protein
MSRQVTLEQLNVVLDTLDELHSAVGEQSAEEATGLSPRELLSILREISYIAQETMREVQQRSQAAPTLRVLPRAERIS